MISNLFSHLIGFTDVAFMGRVGETELAACGIASLIYIVLTMIPYGMSVGFQIIMARRAGEGDYKAIGAVFDNNFLFMIGVSGLMFLFVRFGIPVVLKPLFSSQDIYDAGMKYLYWRSFEVFFTVIALTLAAFYISIGRTYIIIYSAAFMLIVNIIFNYNLVFGKFGFPKMGIAGSGLASFIATASACVLNFIYLWKSKFKHQYYLFRFKKLQWSVVSRSLNLSGPVVIQYLLGTISWLIFFLLVEKMGKQQLAVSNVVREVYMFFGITTWGLANATNAMVSNILGQRRHDEVLELINKVIVVSVAISLFFFAILFSFPRVFMSVFTNDTEIIELGVVPVRIAGISVVMMAVASIYFRGITGTGATKYSLLVEFIVIFVYLIYVILLIPVLHVNLAWAWTSEFVYWLVLWGLCYWFLKSGKWKKYKV
jgi:putative MATE family efflux protein